MVIFMLKLLGNRMIRESVARIPQRPLGRPGLQTAAWIRNPPNAIARQAQARIQSGGRAAHQSTMACTRSRPITGIKPAATIKILSGILHPDAGRVRVLGHEPWRERRALGGRIGTVFGQRSQLWYHLPAADTFDLLARIYDQDPVVVALQEKAMVRLL